MRILVISDIHANFDALERVMAEAEVVGPDRIVCLGDVVGYGADPAECVRLVGRKADVRICGNHDLAAAGRVDYSDFNGVASISIEWTSNRLGDAEREMLAEYEPVRSMEGCLFAHASPLSPLDWEYVYTVAQARRIMEGTGERVVFNGHTHIPGVISMGKDGQARIEQDRLIKMEPGRRYLVNAGSVGQPRDGMNAACYSLVDLDSSTIMMNRVSYDICSAQEKIRAQGLPEVLAGRLAEAR